MARMEMTAKEKRLRRRLISIIIEGVVVLGVILVFFNKAFGWFASNNEVGASGMSVSAYNDDVEADYFSYIYTQKTATATAVNSIADVQVPQYDLIFLQRNRYTPAVIRAVFTGEHDLAESGNITFTITRNTANPLSVSGASVLNPSTSDHLSNTFTSLMRLTAVKGASVYDADPKELYLNLDELQYGNDTLYEVVKDMTGNTAVSKTFVTKTGSGQSATYTKANSIELSIDYTAADWNGDELNIYIYITYDKTLMEDYRSYDASLSGDITSVGQVIQLSNDMLSITAAHN
ncbi:MAG: hypothetical protein IKS88_03455 [Clostridia bacterium]|nr:hypothetical protein [Clostridia bacterium]